MNPANHQFLTTASGTLLMMFMFAHGEPVKTTFASTRDGVDKNMIRPGTPKEKSDRKKPPPDPYFDPDHDPDDGESMPLPKAA